MLLLDDPSCDSHPPAAAGLESESQTRVRISFESIAAGSKSAEAEFSQAERAPVAAGWNVATDTKINQIVQKLATEA